jgi:hypothetical protein
MTAAELAETALSADLMVWTADEAAILSKVFATVLASDAVPIAVIWSMTTRPAWNETLRAPAVAIDMACCILLVKLRVVVPVPLIDGP